MYCDAFLRCDISVLNVTCYSAFFTVIILNVVKNPVKDRNKNTSQQTLSLIRVLFYSYSFVKNIVFMDRKLY